MKSFKSFLVEAMDREYRRELARERRTERERESKRPGVKSHSPGLNAKKTAADYAKSQMGSIKLHDKATKKSGHTVGNPFPEEYQYEECGCEHEEEETKKPKRAPMGGSAAKPGPNKNYVKPMGEEAEKDHEYSMARSELKTLQNAAKRLQKKMGKKGEGSLEAWVQSKITKAADYIDTAADYVTNEAAGEKDACYKKVKRRFKVWPSAYASGALVQCRKKGADNWGNSKKK
jgi:hypothetical protein